MAKTGKLGRGWTAFSQYLAAVGLLLRSERAHPRPQHTTTPEMKARWITHAPSRKQQSLATQTFSSVPLLKDKSCMSRNFLSPEQDFKL